MSEVRDRGPGWDEHKVAHARYVLQHRARNTGTGEWGEWWDSWVGPVYQVQDAEAEEHWNREVHKALDRGWTHRPSTWETRIVRLEKRSSVVAEVHPALWDVEGELKPGEKSGKSWATATPGVRGETVEFVDGDARANVYRVVPDKKG